MRHISQAITIAEGLKISYNVDFLPVADIEVASNAEGLQITMPMYMQALFLSPPHTHNTRRSYCIVSRYMEANVITPLSNSRALARENAGTTMTQRPPLRTPSSVPAPIVQISINAALVTSEWWDNGGSELVERIAQMSDGEYPWNIQPVPAYRLFTNAAKIKGWGGCEDCISSVVTCVCAEHLDVTPECDACTAHCTRTVAERRCPLVGGGDEPFPPFPLIFALFDAIFDNETPLYWRDSIDAWWSCLSWEEP